MLSYQERITIHKIYTWSTFQDYQKHACYFVKWCKEHYGCIMLSEYRQYVDEWLMARSVLAPHSQKLEACALAKVFDCTTEDFIKTAVRHRAGISKAEKPQNMIRIFLKQSTGNSWNSVKPPDYTRKN